MAGESAQREYERRRARRRLHARSRRGRILGLVIGDRDGRWWCGSAVRGINGRNRSKLLDQARRQTAAVTALLRDAGHVDVAVHPALCFVGTKIPWLFAPSSVGGVLITTPRQLSKRLVGKEPARLSPQRVAILADFLESSLPNAIATSTRPSTRRPADHRPTASDTVQPEKHPSTAPTCRCGQPMVRRVRRADQTPFYGCSTFPKCRQTRGV